MLSPDFCHHQSSGAAPLAPEHFRANPWSSGELCAWPRAPAAEEPGFSLFLPQ